MSNGVVDVFCRITRDIAASLNSAGVQVGRRCTGISDGATASAMLSLARDLHLSEDLRHFLNNAHIDVKLYNSHNAHHYSHPLSAAEQHMRSRKLEAAIAGRTDIFEERGKARNSVHRLRSDDGNFNIYKPISGERPPDWWPMGAGKLAIREVAAFRVDELYGFGRVPPTAMTDGPLGPGSVQQWVPSRPYRRGDLLPALERQQLAVLDYIIGNGDRNWRNWRIDIKGSAVAIDHGVSLLDGSRHYRFAGGEIRYLRMRSPFVAGYLHKPLHADILTPVNSDHVFIALHDLNLNERSIDGAVARHEEIQRRGSITGEAWPGPIVEK
ncbi:hypothetical protein ACFYO1_02245 [Nocardia sp. NPDC006044]|uniref:hypothetical protein n=1 Tax=Nocardia sp. NPDC006044 TaxID=3364306 RepID=UPI0036BEA4E7